MLGGDAEKWDADGSYLTLGLADGVTLHLIRDLSAWVPQQGTPWPDDDADLMSRFCQSMFDVGGKDLFLIAVNDGQLIESWRRLPTTEAVQRARDLFEDLLVEDRQQSPGVRLRFFNLSRGSSARLLEQALDAFLGHPGWNGCFDGETGQSVEFGGQSPLRRNYELLSSPLVQERLRDLFELCDANGLHIPIREILALLSNAILGHPDCRDRLMLPADVPKMLKNGTGAKASLYSNLFGGNLTAARRRSINVFNYLDRFRIGYETTNRIDNMLIFGETDPVLNPYFEQFLIADEFYGADDSYRAAQQLYVEGAHEITAKGKDSSAQFLPMLVAQRRALFFKIPPDEAEELRLWELTVFRYAGEYLSRVLRVTRPKENAAGAGERVERAILGRLVRGLNRVFVGMLVTSQNDLILGTSLHSTSAKVSHIWEEKLSVKPRHGGESVEIVWEGNGPALRVALADDLVCFFALNLVRYEFLSRVAEGALPGNFSKECYEDVLGFKSQLLAKLNLRRAHYPTTSDGVLVFNRLVLDDNGNPTSQEIEVMATPDVAPLAEVVG